MPLQRQYQDGLAGLDSLLLHFSLDSPLADEFQSSEVTDATSFVFTSKAKQSLSVKTCRILWPDKTRDDDAITASDLSNISELEQSFLRTFKTQDSSVCQSPIAPCFCPVPPVPSAPFLSRVSDRSPPGDDLLPSAAFSAARSRRSLGLCSTHDVPANSHPNSPYVPWPPSTRLEILGRPTSFNPIPHSSSRAGLSGPLCSSEIKYDQPQDEHRIWRTVKTSIRKGLRTFNKRATRLMEALRCTSASARSDQIWDEFSPIHATLPPVASDSIDSVATTSLEQWLVTRQQLASHALAPEHLVSLENYESRGSWLEANLEHHAEPDIHDFLYHKVPFSTVNSPTFSPTFSLWSDYATVSSNHDASVLFTLQQLNALCECSSLYNSDHPTPSLHSSSTFTATASEMTFSFEALDVFCDAM